MICVKIYWNTDVDGRPVPEDTPLEDGPISYYGPFDSMTDAISWMENDYPEDDEDVMEMVADDFYLPWHVERNVISPDSIFGDIPDEDIRDDDDEPTLLS